MNLSDEEFLSLSGQMSDRDVKIATLENKVEQLERDLLVARAECEEREALMTYVGLGFPFLQK